MLRVVFTLAVLFLPATERIATDPLTPTWPVPPFDAWVPVRGARVHLQPDVDAPEVGILSYGDTVRVLSCAPACDRRGAWAILDGPGAVRLDLLAPPPPRSRASDQGATASYVYGRLRLGGGVFAEPDRRSRIVEHRRIGNDLAFVDDPELSARGWLRRPAGGYVPRGDVRLHQPSGFTGVQQPPPAVAFAIRPSKLSVDGSASRAVRRYEWFPALALASRDRVLVEGGSMPRRDLRLARWQPRPAGVAEGARWVHVDIDEQVLTAYEGDELVFATLVSTGRKDHRTRAGLFPVFYKSIHADMHGSDPGEPYFVDEVPWIMFFRKGMALHGTFWHDAFGRSYSHGCVNLSFSDAKWLFDWAPPKLPAGWHAIEPLEGGLATLWVKVEHARPRALP